MNKCIIVQARTGLWGEVRRISGQSWGLDKSARGAHLDAMFQITWDIGMPLCASLNIVLHLLETLPSFPANLTYQSNSTIICGFVPEAYAQPWLGIHSPDLEHTPPFNSRRKAEDVLKEAILCSTGGSAATTVRTGLSTSTSTAPKQIGRDAKALPPQYALHPSADAPNPLLRTTHGPAPPLLVGVQCPSADQEGVIWAHLVHRAQVPDPAVAVGPVMGPKLDPKPVQARDLSTRKQHQMEVLKSSLEMRLVQARMMSWTLPTRQTYHKGVCPCLTSLPQMMRIPAKAKHVNLPAKVTLTSRHGKTNSSMKGWWAYKSGMAWWMTMLMLGREDPRTLTP